MFYLFVLPHLLFFAFCFCLFHVVGRKQKSRGKKLSLLTFHDKFFSSCFLVKNIENSDDNSNTTSEHSDLEGSHRQCPARRI